MFGRITTHLRAIAITACVLLTGCASSVPDGVVAPHESFAIYLVKKLPMHPWEIERLPLDSLQLESVPYLAEGDLESYSWQTDEMILRPEAASRIYLRHLRYFVVTVGSKRMYCGAFPRRLEDSYVPMVPQLRMGERDGRTVVIIYPSPDWSYQESGNSTPDVRADRRIHDALQSAGILKDDGPKKRQASIGSGFIKRSDPFDSWLREPLSGSSKKAKTVSKADTLSGPCGPFEIYLLWDSTMRVSHAETVPLDSLQLNREPLFTGEDLEEYIWPRHEFVVRRESQSHLFALGRRPFGIPFVVTVGKTRIYLGAFMRSYDSFNPRVPYITIDNFGGRRLAIRRGSLWPFSEAEDMRVDGRSDRRIHKALQEIGVLVEE